ncbi:MAG: hypothetical protein ACLPSF_04925 [Methylocella sp.]
MDGMLFQWWDIEDESGGYGSSTTRSFTLNFPQRSLIAELSVSTVEDMLVSSDHYVASGFTSCSWIDASGTTHNENFVSPSAFSWPAALSRNGVTSLSGEIDADNMETRVTLNVFFWPSVS